MLHSIIFIMMYVTYMSHYIFMMNFDDDRCKIMRLVNRKKERIM